MKGINFALLILGLALACLPTSYAQGVESGSADAVNAEIEDAFENEHEDSFERLLSRSRLQTRCPFPGEPRDTCKEGKRLYKTWKWCKKYCYVCPCWDEKSYYDFNGNLIEGKRCKAIQILPADHFLCLRRCVDAVPIFNSSINDYVCDGYCPCEDKECVGKSVNVKGKGGAPNREICSCETSCNNTKPMQDENGTFFCSAKCPHGGTCSSDEKGTKCCCGTRPWKEDFLSMSDKELFDYAANGGKIGNWCTISTSQGGTACTFYVKSRTSDPLLDPSYHGVPGGSGCVVGPGSWEGACWYNPRDGVDPKDGMKMCTNDTIANGAAMIRWGINNGRCDIPC